jgi:hypothetical protein
MKTAVVQLGRYGDILNILPVLQQLDDPVLVTSEECADIGQSISYATVDPFDGDIFDEYFKAVSYARTKYDRVLPTQVCPAYAPDLNLLDGFMEQSCALAGPEHVINFRAGKYDDILIDRRSEEREAKLCKAHLKKDARVLLNLSGHSSPFPCKEKLVSLLQERGIGFVDMASIRAEVFTDLLGLFDRVPLLVTADTGTLHLAGAHGRIPYIAFVNTVTPWHAGYCRGTCLMRVEYSRAERWLAAVVSTIERVLSKAVYSIINVYPGDAISRRKKRMADITRFACGLGFAQLGSFNDISQRPEEKIVLSKIGTCFTPGFVRHCLELGETRSRMPMRYNPSVTHQPLLSDQVATLPTRQDEWVWIFPRSDWLKYGDKMFADTNAWISDDLTLAYTDAGIDKH